MDVLQKHLSERPHGLGILVRVQAHEQNQLVVDYVLDRQQIVVLSRDGRQLVVQKRHALVDQALNFRNTLAILDRLHQVLDAHFEIQALLRGDRTIAIETMHGLFDLLLQNVLVKQHHDHVIEVVAGASIEQDADDVAEVVQLMLGEKLVMQVKAAKDHVYLCHVVVVTREEWVVQRGELGT